jgi:hypothetical protein
MKLLLLKISLGISISGMAQQISPIELISAPRENRFAISGVGGGNFYEANLKTGSSSAQTALDINMKNWPSKTAKGMEKITTLGLIVKYNPRVLNRLIQLDSLIPKKLPFSDNEYNVHFGFRVRRLRDLGAEEESNSFMLNAAFFDILHTPYNVSLTDTTTSHFDVININTGYQFGLYGDVSGIGDYGFSIALQGNFLKIISSASEPTGFEKSLRATKNLPSNMIGYGGKFLFQLNDFSLYFEMRGYFPINSSVQIEGLTGVPLLSFGGIATGTAFTKRKKIN